MCALPAAEKGHPDDAHVGSLRVKPEMSHVSYNSF